MFRGFGEYAVVVSVDAPLTTLTPMVGPEGKGVGEGDGAGDELPPQAMETVRTIMGRVIRSDTLSSFVCERRGISVSSDAARYR